MSHMDRKDLIQFSADTTTSPYEAQITAPMKRSNDEASLQYFYDAKQMESMNKTAKKHCGARHSDRGPSEPCWFCLGSPKVEKHFIVSIGKQVSVIEHILRFLFIHITICY